MRAIATIAAKAAALVAAAALAASLTGCQDQGAVPPQEPSASSAPAEPPTDWRALRTPDPTAGETAPEPSATPAPATPDPVSEPSEAPAPSEPVVEAVSGTAHPTVVSLNTRSGPGTQYPVTGSVGPYDTLSYDGASSGWYRLKGGDWVSAAYTAQGAAPERPAAPRSAEGDSGGQTGGTASNGAQEGASESSEASVWVRAHGGQAEIDASNGAVYYDEVAQWLGRPYVAMHNSAGAWRWTQWSTGQRVRLSGVVSGLYEVVEMRWGVRRDQADVLPGVAGDVLLQTCETGGTGGNLVVGLRKVG